MPPTRSCPSPPRCRRWCRAASPWPNPRRSSNTWKTPFPRPRTRRCTRPTRNGAPARASCRRGFRSDLMALREERPTTVVFKAAVCKPLTEAGRAAADKLIRVAASLIGEGADHLFGDWCIADTELALMLNRLVAHGDAVPENLKCYVQVQWARPSVQAWLRHEA
ncbi:MAG: hypothetical protein M5R42_01795 [Rhodocyclaceae bacterium]|nr:hypothetical protein [Rhodocyclaceae bacterium]